MAISSDRRSAPDRPGFQLIASRAAAPVVASQEANEGWTRAELCSALIFQELPRMDSARFLI